MLNLKIDYRQAGKPRYYVAEENEKLMQIPANFRKCVVFVGGKTKDGLKYATGFCVGVPAEGFDGYCHGYIVTAKHVIDEIKKNSTDGKVILRVNNKNNSAESITTESDHWKFHPTEDNVDVAVLSLTLPEDKFDSLVIADENAINQEKIEKDAIDAGDEVFLTGLFKYHYGTQRNLPIIRMGNIALMPEEKVWVDWEGGKYIEAYLIEARSIGGLSGSPVFVATGIQRIIDNTAHFNAPSGKRFHWLGLMHGHWDIPKDKIDTPVDDKNKDASVNVGIGIVVPASKIMQVINHPDFKEARKQKEKKMRNKTAPTPDA